MIWFVLYQALEILKWLVLARVLMSWFVSPLSENPLVNLVRRITDPILRPISEMVPPLGGIDISPLLAFFAIYLFQQVILRMA
jgi:YggT family protein